MRSLEPLPEQSGPLPEESAEEERARSRTMLGKLGVVAGVLKAASMFKRTKKRLADRAAQETSRENRAQRKWQQMVWDHLPQSEPQLKRFAVWKEDYARFLKTHADFDEGEGRVKRILGKRGKCECRLSGMSAGAMDPVSFGGTGTGA